MPLPGEGAPPCLSTASGWWPGGASGAGRGGAADPGPTESSGALRSDRGYMRGAGGLRAPATPHEANGCRVDAPRVHHGHICSPMPNLPAGAPACGHGRCRPSHLSAHCSRSITSPSDTRKSMSAGVDMECWCGYGFSRNPERQQGLAETNCRPAVPAVRRTVRWWSSEARVVAGRRRTDDRTGWPQCQGPPRAGPQYPAAKSVSSTSVKASAAGARTGKFGSGVLSQSRRRRATGRLPKSGATAGR